MIIFDSLSNCSSSEAGAPIVAGALSAAGCGCASTDSWSQACEPATRHLCGCCVIGVQGDILEDIELIENLEETKRTAVEIEEKVAQAKNTEVSISAAREVYRPVAARGSQVYFLIDNLNALDR